MTGTTGDTTRVERVPADVAGPPPSGRESAPAGERPVERSTRRRERSRRAADRLLQFVDFMFSLLYALLGVRLVLGLIGANESAGFVGFILLFTQPFYAPFADIVASPPLTRGEFDLSLLFGIMVYALLHLALRRLLHLLVGVRPT